MSFSNKLTTISNNRLSATGKSTLNPNATEFIPSFSAATLPGASCAIEVSIPAISNLSASNAVLDRSKSSVSNNSDEEARQFWSCQLPDDITPDFNDEELKGIENLSLEEATEGLRFASSTASRIVLNQQQEFSTQFDGNSFITSMRTPVSSFGARPSSASSLNVNAKAWEAPTSKKNLVLDNSSNRPPPYSGNTGDFIDDILSDSGIVDANEVDSLSFLANQFPGFAYESLAEAYIANQHNLNLTVEMLTQLELQADGGFSKVMNSKSSSALNPNAPVFHSHTVHEGKNSRQNYTRDGLLQTIDPYQPSDQDCRLLFSPASSIPTKASIDLDSGIRNPSLQKSSSWKYEGNGAVDMGIGSSRRSDLLASYKDQVSSFAGKVPSPSSTNKTSVWFGNGQALYEMTGNVHPELREEVSHHAGLLNTYLQQARPSYSMVDKSPAKELDTAVRLHSMRMKPVHVESVYNQSNTRRQERIIDVHDLHVSDAIHVLNHELNTIRSAARASDQTLPVCICVGPDGHTRGSFTPAKLPAAVRRYLLEEERLDYSELQPGLLRVIIC